ncbi:MAG: PAS domain-containing sensor histidine kinase, partial [Candidatus Cloacimonadaceae bacterium]|nr:PAS domain-containing sensor histidine kinase [Candidatus Cloacimonadaceae bacterium]
MISDGIDAFHKDGVKSFNVLLPELMSNLLHNLPGIAYRCRNDSKWTMLFLSEGCYPLTGYQPIDLLYNSERSYDDIIFSDDRVLVRNAVNNAVVNRTQFQVTYRIVTKDGELKWVWEQGNAVYDQHNHPFFLDGFIADITSRKKAEDALEKSAAILAELNTMKDKFFSTIAHDLQNPIYSIITLSDFIHQNAQNFTQDQLIDFINQINASAKSAHTLLENLLDWARSQTGRLKLRPLRLNLAKLIDDCILLHSVHAVRKNIRIEKNIPPELYIESDYQ